MQISPRNDLQPFPDRKLLFAQKEETSFRPVQLIYSLIYIPHRLLLRLLLLMPPLLWTSWQWRLCFWYHCCRTHCVIKSTLYVKIPFLSSPPLNPYQRTHTRTLRITGSPSYGSSVHLALFLIPLRGYCGTLSPPFTYYKPSGLHNSSYVSSGWYQRFHLN